MIWKKVCSNFCLSKHVLDDIEIFSIFYVPCFILPIETDDSEIEMNTISRKNPEGLKMIHE